MQSTGEGQWKWEPPLSRTENKKKLISAVETSPNRIPTHQCDKFIPPSRTAVSKGVTAVDNMVASSSFHITFHLLGCCLQRFDITSYTPFTKFWEKLEQIAYTSSCIQSMHRHTAQAFFLSYSAGILSMHLVICKHIQAGKNRSSVATS